MKLHLIAPAKVNWTLEALGRRPDGYHEVMTVLQTLDLCDRVILSPARDVQVRVTGRVADLSGVSAEENLAFRAAVALRQEVAEAGLGALIELEKVVPAAAGLGGASSDAAAALRGLNRLWGLDLPPAELSRIGATLGADVPFFLHGGTAQASGRGDDVAPLPDVPSQRLLIALPPPSLPRKTTQMYGRLRPEHYTQGEHTRRLVDRLAASESLSDGDIFNVFERVLGEAMPEVEEAIRSCQTLGLGTPHLAGSGPAFFYLLPEGQEIPEALQDRLLGAGLELLRAKTLPSERATAWEEEG